MQRFILNALHFLGLLLIMMSLFGLGMYMLGYETVGLGGENEIGFAYKGFEFKTKTGHIYYGIFVGLILAISPFPVSKYFGKVAEVEAMERAIPSIAKLKEGGYKISEQDERIDLRNRKEIGRTEYLGGDLSETTRLVRRVIKDLDGDVKEVNFRHATSGYGIVVQEKPSGAKWQKIEEQSKDVVYNPFVDLLRGREFFKELLARKGGMRSYYLTVPVTEGKGQEIVYTLRYYNAYQGSDFEWAGKLFSADTDRLTMHITFPKDKPLRSFETYKSAPHSKEKIRIDHPEVETAPDGHTLTWRIRDAMKGETYFVKWVW